MVIPRGSSHGCRRRPRLSALWWAAVVCAGVHGIAASAAEPADTEVERLKQELEDVKARLERMEQLVERLTDGRAETAAATPRDLLRVTGVEADPAAGQDVAVEVLGGASPGAERVEEAEPAAPRPDVHVGGALRFNAFFRDFEDSSETKRGESGLDLFRLGFDGEYRDVLVSAEYRWYPYMDTLHHGWVGYELDDESRVELGVHKVPFGILPYASHNYWFGVPYYAGMADDYDLGVKYRRTDGPWNTQLAFYKSEEQGDPTSLERYGFDVVRGGDQQDEEVNRFNLRLARTFGAGTGCEHELGISGQRGQLYNADTDDSGSSWAAAAHLDSRCGRWNLQLQGARYEYHPENPPGVDDTVVRMGAFATSYEVAAEADMLVANLAYNFDVAWPAVDQITCYNDYSRLFKDGDGFEDSQINTTGCAVGMGSLFTYLDVIQASNMPLFGAGTLGRNGDDEWLTRINLNVGYYW